jgi:hypothetical protein
MLDNNDNPYESPRADLGDAKKTVTKPRPLAPRVFTIFVGAVGGVVSSWLLWVIALGHPNSRQNVLAYAIFLIIGGILGTIVALRGEPSHQWRCSRPGRSRA